MGRTMIVVGAALLLAGTAAAQETRPNILE
jgi:hypothetical protein